MNTEALHYEKWGTGNQVLLCFHGVGQDHRLFQAYESELEGYTILTFDLFYHGKSDREAASLSIAGWAEYLRAVLKREGVGSFSIVAFSLGGRFAIATVMAFTQHIDSLVLIAPDGIWRSPWYLAATSPLLNPLFRYLMYHPRGFDTLLTWVEKTGLASHAMIRFSRLELLDLKKQEQVYKSWTFFAKLQVTPAKFQDAIRSNFIKAMVILGKKDILVPPTKIKSRINADVISIREVNAKHGELIMASLDEIKLFFSHPQCKSN